MKRKLIEPDHIQAIRHASRQLVRELHLLDGRHCIEGFAFSECHLITELEALGRSTATELAKRLVLEKSTMSRLCSGLLAQGYLEAVRDQSDGRQKLLELSSKGKDGAIRIHRHARQQVGDALLFVAEAERSAISAGLGRYARALRSARLSHGVKIRRIRQRDNPAVARIIRGVMTEYGAVGEGYSIEDPEVDDMFSAYSGNRSAFFVIEKNDAVVGCGGIAPLESGPKENKVGENGVSEVCELRKMYFLPELRGIGMGTRLLELCLEMAREKAYRHCYLETIEAMEEARHLYRKHGFTHLEAPMGNTRHSACNAWMAKDL